MNRHSNRHTSEEVQDAFKVLMTHGFCNSHDVSHFAAFFIVVGAKTSVAESVDYVILFTTPSCDRDGALFNDSLSGCFVLFPIKDLNGFGFLSLAQHASRDSTRLHSLRKRGFGIQFRM